MASQLRFNTVGIIEVKVVKEGIGETEEIKGEEAMTELEENLTLEKGLMGSMEGHMKKGIEEGQEEEDLGMAEMEEDSVKEEIVKVGLVEVMIEGL